MAITTITLTDRLVGTIVSPAADGYITHLEKTRTQWPPVQVENWVALPYPHGVWKTGRFVLRQGDGRRIYSFQNQSAFDGVLLATPTRFLGDLALECLPLGEEWRIDFSDTPTRARSPEPWWLKSPTPQAAQATA
jgi:hypothetical protein